MYGYDVVSYIVGECDFLSAVRALKNGECASIYGPSGGILILDENGCLVYADDGDKIYFRADCYLGTWRLLKEFEL